MREALEFVEQYRHKGYPDERVRIIASMRPEPLRSEVLKVLDESKAQAHQSPPQTAETGDADRGEQTHEVEVKPQKTPAAVESPAPQATAKTERPKAPPAEAAPAAKRAQPSAEQKKMQSELKRLRAESAKAKQLLKRVTELEGVRDELEEARRREETLTSETAAASEKLAALEATVGEKDSLLAEKNDKMRAAESSLARERAERKIAVSCANEHEDSLKKQEARLAQLKPLGEKLRKATARAAALGDEVEGLKENEQASTSHVAELEAEMAGVQETSGELREQLASNEQAVEDLQGNLSARESELESLREHFDREAKDLQKRAEQETWIIQRKLGRMKTYATVGTLAAALFLIVLVIQFSTGSGASSNANVAGLKKDLSDSRQQNDALTKEAEVLRNQRQDALKALEEYQRIAEAGRQGTQDRILGIPNRDTQPALDDPPPPQPNVKYHVVQKGDMLWDISQRFLGDGSLYQKIADENGLDKDDIKRLPVGTRLKITIPADR